MTQTSSERCSATTASGARCRRAALAGGRVCHVHAGAAVGRPTLLNENVIRRIVAVLRAGGYPDSAAQAAGIAARTYRDWMRWGDPAGEDPRHKPFRELRAQVEQARAEAEARNVALIAQAANSNWQAAAWLLERQYPERWARPSQREKDEAPVAAPPAPGDPFAEVDELARRRRDA